MMPADNGVTLAKEIRKIFKYAKTPIIMMSGVFPPSQMEKVKTEVSNAYTLCKPFTGDDLKKIINEAVPKEAAKR
jgi:DNA-binding response OmpR family regulator